MILVAVPVADAVVVVVHSDLRLALLAAPAAPDDVLAVVSLADVVPHPAAAFHDAVIVLGIHRILVLL